MAKTKTSVETDGSIAYANQSADWLHERLSGVIESIKANADGGHKEDLETFKRIVTEMKLRGMLA